MGSPAGARWPIAAGQRGGAAALPRQQSPRQRPARPPCCDWPGRARAGRGRRRGRGRKRPAGGCHGGGGAGVRRALPLLREGALPGGPLRGLLHAAHLPLRGLRRLRRPGARPAAGGLPRQVGAAPRSAHAQGLRALGVSWCSWARRRLSPFLLYPPPRAARHGGTLHMRKGRFALGPSSKGSSPFAPLLWPGGRRLLCRGRERHARGHCCPQVLLCPPAGNHFAHAQRRCVLCRRLQPTHPPPPMRPFNRVNFALWTWEGIKTLCTCARDTLPSKRLLHPLHALRGPLLWAGGSCLPCRRRHVQRLPPPSRSFGKPSLSFCRKSLCTCSGAP